jgi:Fe-S oxidoreductase
MGPDGSGGPAASGAAGADCLYDPSEPAYWEPGSLRREIDRSFAVCGGCRLCFKYCDSFPRLFDFLDSPGREQDPRRLSGAEVDQVAEACFQCRLCEVQCPYTRREGHLFRLDFPALIARHRAQRHEKRRLRLRDWLLARPDLAARLARLWPSLANASLGWRPFRRLLEAFAGIHRDKRLPPFARETFDDWVRDGAAAAAPGTSTTRRESPPAPLAGVPREGPGGEAVLFPTCYVENNEPSIGRDALFVLGRNGLDVRCQLGLSCCGMPAWEQGDLDFLRRSARSNLRLLLPHLQAGSRVAVLGPSCALLMRREYPELVSPEDKPAARLLAAAVVDPSELLWSIRDEPRFDSVLASKPSGRVACHAPCHLRAQTAGLRTRDLLRRLLGEPPALVAECCGHDGTYAMKTEGYEPSARLGRKAFEGVSAGGGACVTDCPLAALQFSQHAGVAAMHPMTLLARAYRGERLP